MIDWLFETVREALAGNQFFQGGFVLMAMGAAFATLRYLPGLVWGFAQRHFTVSMHLRNPGVVGWLGEWLAATEYGQKCRRLNGVIVQCERKPMAVLEPGIGTHFFRYGYRWFWLEHELEDAPGTGASLGKLRTMTLRTWGRDPQVLRTILERAIREAMENRKGKQVAYINDDYGDWMNLRVGALRPFDSVVLAPEIQIAVREDAEWFFDARDWHLERGLPYRRGYLLHGPAGNGKSSLVQALAGMFEIPVYVLSLTSKGFGDRDLAIAMGHVDSRAVVVIEDVEKLSLGRKKGVTLVGLLNAVDGALASDGRLLIMTANDKSKIDPVLLRPGRIDRQWFIGPPQPAETARLFSRFFPSENDLGHQFASKVEADISMAAVQQHLARHHDDPAAAVKTWDSDLLGAIK